MFVMDDSNCPEVMFYDTSYSGSPTSQVIYWSYDFGDGNSSTMPNTSNTYASNGTYLVCLTIATSDGCVSTYCDSVVVDCIQGSSCDAMFYYQNDSSCTYYFFDYSSASTGIVEWDWSFGDGGTSTDQHPVYTYSANGWYNVCLTMTSADSCTNTYCDSVYVNCIAGLTSESLDNYTISPNPANDHLNITIENASEARYEIVGLNGAVYKTGRLSNQLNTIDVSLLSNGIYLLKLESMGRIAVSKFAKN